MRIEGFDISNISGTFKVASLVSFKNGRPDRANYRWFKAIKTVEGQDDFASMAEVWCGDAIHGLKSEAEHAGAPAQKNKNDDSGEAIPQELQTLVDETGRKVQRGILVNDQILTAAHDRRRSQSAATNMPDLILIDGGKATIWAWRARNWKNSASKKFPSSAWRSESGRNLSAG